MNKDKKLLNIFCIILGIANIIIGLLFILIVFAMQGFYLVFLGVFFIVFGVALFKKKYYKKLLFYGIVPITILLSLHIVMSMVTKDIPEYCRTPVGIGTFIISSFWLVVCSDIFICKRICRNLKIRDCGDSGTSSKGTSLY